MLSTPSLWAVDTLKVWAVQLNFASSQGEKRVNPIFSSSYFLNIRLLTKNQFHMFSGSALNAQAGWGGGAVVQLFT